MKLTIVVEFERDLSTRGEADVKKIVHDLKEDVGWLGGKVVSAELAKGHQTPPTESSR